MKSLLIILLNLTLAGQLFAETKVIKLTKEEIKKLSEYFISSNEKKQIAFPLDLTKHQVRDFSFISGIHRIWPREEESMFAIYGDRIIKGKKISRILYKFTITPQLTVKDKKNINWKLYTIQ
jgi:hypothetical protein